jgi:hypothetical protein
MEKIKNQFVRAASNSSTKGMENFLRRLSTVIEKRSHSVEDLLKFLERGDLPIADDGSILIYKVLNRTGSKYVDCHSKKVEQWVGAYVCMDESLVDRNRNNECSNGLHVARRGYISGFGGDVCVIAKLAPEDVIAVPTYDSNKMRVCGYHIIVELTDKQFSALKFNKPITDIDDGGKLLANVMSGAHIHKTHEVRIKGQMGTNVVVTELDTPFAPSAPKAKAEVSSLDSVSESMDAPVKVEEVLVKVEQLTKKQQAQKLYADGDYEKLFALKKSSKVSWDKLGITEKQVKKLESKK